MAFHNVPPNGFPDLPDVEELEAVQKDVKTLKTTTAEQGAAITNLNSTKANQITIAPFFSAETAYDPGDLVYYNGLSYRCVNAHEGDWDADDFAATTIAGELSEVKSGLTDVTNGLMSPISAVNKIAMSDANMVNHDIGVGYDFTALTAENHVTWFTNWSDDNNFPALYGSGVLIPGKDSSNKAIIYIALGLGGGAVYTNSYMNNAWGSWRQLEFTT